MFQDKKDAGDEGIEKINIALSSHDNSMYYWGILNGVLQFIIQQKLRVSFVLFWKYKIELLTKVKFYSRIKIKLVFVW